MRNRSINSLLKSYIRNIEWNSQQSTGTQKHPSLANKLLLIKNKDGANLVERLSETAFCSWDVDKADLLWYFGAGLMMLKWWPNDEPKMVWRWQLNIHIFFWKTRRAIDQKKTNYFLYITVVHHISWRTHMDIGIKCTLTLKLTNFTPDLDWMENLRSVLKLWVYIGRRQSSCKDDILYIILDALLFHVNKYDNWQNQLTYYF